jgi:hypothetical protein
MSDQPPQADPAAAFSRMADKIRHNAENGFAGAFVIVPPGDGPAIEVLILEPASNEAVIWGQIKARIEMRLADIEDAQRRGQTGWGMNPR